MSLISKILSSKIKKNQKLIEEFFDEKFSKVNTPFYNSVDLRHSGFKIAPVDTNCYPAGFNNLSKIGQDNAKKMATQFFAKNFSSVNKILIIPENHTRNFNYFENISILISIMGINKEIIVGSIDPEIKDDFEINLESGSKFKVFKLKKNQNKLITSNGFEADLIILNNDLTDGIPDILKNITIPIIPSPNMGWHQRTKSNHFTIYNQFAIEVAKILEIDPWLISSFHQNCGNVDFKEQKGMQCIIDNVDKILKDLQNKYKQHSIKETPYCYVKADNGTYGMAVWSVNSPEEIISINKKERNKMNIIKGSTKNSKVIIQEGIPTTDKINDFSCEPLIYMINADVVENLFRANQNRDNKTSLNASGASFYNSYNIPLINNISENKEEYFLVYRFIARLSSLASSFELIPNPIFK